jgi:tetratricopeptide (TPR) repeat protein
MESANFRLPVVKFQSFHFSFFIFAFALVISGCTAFQVGSEIQAGRKALRNGEPKIALTHFQRAAELDPNYLLDFSLLDQGVWTYIGRSYYDSGNFAEARKAFDSARSRYDRDYMAKLYLGMVLARDGDRERGLKEMESGLRGLGGWLEYLDQNRDEGRFWDPSRRLRSQIQKDVAMISAKDVNWQTVVANGEWLGQQFEEEIEKVRRDKQRIRDNDEGSRSDRR